MNRVWIEAQADGEDVVIRVGANDAERIVAALHQHARRSSFPTDYRDMADAIEKACEQAFKDGATGRPGLKLVVVPL